MVSRRGGRGQFRDIAGDPEAAADLVNLGRVREIEQGFKGTLFLATDTPVRELVPVARRHAPQLRQALGF